MSAIADAELDLFRRSVHCAAVLERMAGGWRLDLRASTKRALKYRRGAGEIIIVNHDGRGWWDATGSAKGDVFDLVRLRDAAAGGVFGKKIPQRRAAMHGNRQLLTLIAGALVFVVLSAPGFLSDPDSTVPATSAQGAGR